MQENILDYIDNITKVTAEKERIGAELSVASQRRLHGGNEISGL